jgi:hypothetical protein
VLFDIQTGKELLRLDKSDWIHCAALSPDGTQILTGADAPTEHGTPLMRLWDAKTGKEIRRFPGPTARIHDVAFSPNGQLCVSCGAFGDNTLRVFDLASGKELHRMAHPDGLNLGAFLPDGQRYLTTSYDGVIRAWDVRNGQKLFSFKAHTGAANAVAVSRDGRYALSGGADKTLRLWRLPDPPPAEKPGQVRQFDGQGFVPLFNGKDKTGWKTHPKQPGNWYVTKDGILISSGPTSHLYTERGDYKDFHLRAEARINDGGNSGLMFRAPFGPAWPAYNPQFPACYEAQINSTHRDPNKTGSLYEVAEDAVAVVSLKESPVPPNQWFTEEVIAQGNHIVVKVNGKTTADFTDEKRRFTSGHIALQQHDPQTVAEFRKVEIKELK